MKLKEIQKLSREQQLNRAREIYDEVNKTGVYRPHLITEGFNCVYPDKELPVGFAQRRQFMGYMQYMYDKVMAELDSFITEVELDAGQTLEVEENGEVLFSYTKEGTDPDQTDLDFDNAEQSHEEQLNVEDEEEIEPEKIKTKGTTVKAKAKTKRKYTKRKK